jgi:hypothetical protein
VEDEGEIAPLDADRLDDYQNAEAREEIVEVDLIDQRAIASVAANLKKTATGQTLSEDRLFEMSESLYAKTCQMIASGQASDQQIDKAAELFSEDRTDLLDRLGVQDNPEANLLKNLFSK